MRIPGKSDIIDQLAAETGQPRYNIRQLSHEIILRSGSTSSTWINTNGAKLSLIAIDDSRYRTYELFVQEKNDTDVHLYTYGTVSSSLQYKYPLFTHHTIEDPEQVKQDIAKLLLSGPVFDRVANNQIENRIQKIFLTIARSLPGYEPVGTQPFRR